MSAAAMPGLRPADPGAGVARPVARRTSDAAPDTFGALLAGHGPAPARDRAAVGRHPDKPQVDSPATGRGSHRSTAPRGRSVSPEGHDTPEAAGTDAVTPAAAATDSPATRAPEVAPGVGGVADAPAAAQSPSSTAAPSATELGVPAVPSTSTDSPTAQRISAAHDAATATTTAATPATTGTAAATAAAPGAPVTAATAATAVTRHPAAAVAAAGASGVTGGVVATGSRRDAVRDGGPVAPASADTAAGPVMPAAAFSVPAAVVAPTTSGPTTSAPPLPAAPVPTQVLAAVSPFVRGDDGSYAVQLQLHPHDLGAVQVTVDVRHGEISVHLHTPDGAAQDALRDGLADLRRQLEEQGLRTGSMEVGSGGPQQQREDARRQPVGLVVPGTRAPAAGPGPATGGATTALDLRM